MRRWFSQARIFDGEKYLPRAESILSSLELDKAKGWGSVKCYFRIFNLGQKNVFLSDFSFLNP